MKCLSLEARNIGNKICSVVSTIVGTTMIATERFQLHHVNTSIECNVTYSSFFTKAPQYKSATIANFVLKVKGIETMKSLGYNPIVSTDI